MVVAVYVFMGAVVVIGVGLGFWLQGMLEESHQDIKLPSAMEAKAA